MKGGAASIVVAAQQKRVVQPAVQFPESRPALLLVQIDIELLRDFHDGEENAR